MFGYSHSPASLPCPASTWWNSPPGHAAGPSWQPHTDTQWWGHPPPSAPAWARPATHIHILGEPPVQWMHPATGHHPPNQPLTIMAYPNQQPMPQQHCHCIATPLCPAQPKEQDLVLKRIKQATDRMAQLATAVKAQQEEVNQGSAAMKQYVSEQMAEWRTWKESDEHQPTRKRNKSESAHVTEHSEPTEPDKKLKAPSNVPRHSRLREAQTGHDTMELEVRPSIRQMLTGLETLIRNQADSGIKRRRPPSEDNQQPPKRTTR